MTSERMKEIAKQLREWAKVESGSDFPGWVLADQDELLKFANELEQGKED